MSEIKIKPIANYHGLFLIALGSVGLIFLLLVASYLDASQISQYKLVLLLVSLITLVTIFVGVVKKIEPNFAYHLTPEYIRYQHKYGRWQINWSDIQTIAQVRITSGISFKNMPYIGIKLKPEVALETSISPRLASRLIHEQRPLTLNAITHELITFEQAQINFKATSSPTVKKLKALLLHLCITQQGFKKHLATTYIYRCRPLIAVPMNLSSC